MANSRPGVTINETLLTANVAPSGSGAVAAFVGPIAKGPVGPTLISSWQEYQRIFGGFIGTDQRMPHALYQFFANGGRQVYIVRALGTGAAVATNAASSTASDPDPAIDFNASSAGAWGNQVYVEIIDSQTTGYSDLVIRLVPASATVVTDQMIVETWRDVSLNPLDQRYILTMVNNEVNGSRWITPSVHAGYAYTDDDVLTASTGMAVGSGTPLSGGTAGADGDAPTNGASGQLITALQLLDSVFSPLVVNIPGLTDTTTVNAALAYGDFDLGGRGDIWIVVDPQQGRSASQLVSDKAAFTGSSFGGMWAPWVVVADPSSTLQGATKSVPPGASMVGQIMSTDASRGVFKTPAGVGNRLPILDVETRFKNSELDALNVAGVNAIRFQPGVGYCAFGGRTLKTSPDDKYISVRRSLIYLEDTLRNVTAFAVFEPNDDVLWGTLTSVCQQVLRDFWTAGGLKGGTPEQAYFVVCNDTNNTDATEIAGEVHIQVGVALQRPAEFVIIDIGQFQGGSSVSDSLSAVAA